MPKDLNSIEKRESKEIKQVIPTDLRAVKETKTMNYFLFLSTKIQMYFSSKNIQKTYNK